MVSQASSYHGEIFVLLQHKWLVTGNQMSVVRTEIVEEAFHTKTQMRGNFVIYATSDHETGLVIATAESEWAVVGRDHNEIGVSIDESDAAGTIKQPIACSPTEATASAGQIVDVIGEIDVAFDTQYLGARLPIVAGMHATN